MKLRHALIMGILVFLNGFVFTVLLLMLSRELAHPAATPTTAVTVGPTFQPTFTSTPVGPSPTSTLAPTATSMPEATATNTLVIGPPTATRTNTPIPPTATTGPATATQTPGGPTATSPPPTATPTTPPSSPTPQPSATAQPTATPRGNWDFEYVANSMRTSANCAGPYFKGVILGQGGTAANGIAVHFWFYGVSDCKVSGEGESTGEWGFNPGLAESLKNTHIEFYLQVADNCTNLAPRSEVLTIPFDKACDAGQFENITFRYTR